MVTLLTCFEQQTVKPDRAYISLSSDKPEWAATICAKAKKLNIVVLEQDKKLMQFEHYDKLIAALGSSAGDNEWILFSDDDDEWSADRTKLYRLAIEQLENKDIQTMMHSSAKDDVHSKNYWNGAIRLPSFAHFMSKTPVMAKKHRFCDCLLFRFMCKPSQLAYFGSPKVPLYKWNVEEKDGYAHASGPHQEQHKSPPLHIGLTTNFDVFMAQSETQSLTDWMKMCESKSKSFSKSVKEETGLDMTLGELCMRHYYVCYDSHLFRNKFLEWSS